MSALEGEQLLDADEGNAEQPPVEEYDENDLLGLNATMQANEQQRRRRRAATPSSASERVAKRAAATGSHLYTIVLLIYTTLAAAEDVGDTGKVWLISDIFDTLWHRCEMRINQVRRSSSVVGMFHIALITCSASCKRTLATIATSKITSLRA